MGQIIEFNPDRIPPEEYTPEKGQHIAEGFADGEALRVICENSEGWLPSMLIVRRWRSMFPAFDSLMVEAAACRAENMAEDILNMADDDTQQAAHNRNRMKAREMLAGWMAPASYGDGPGKDAATQDAAPVYALTDEQLLSIAAGKLPALEGESVRVDRAEGVHPPTERDPGTQYEVSGPQQPESVPGEPSVTTNGKDNVRGVIDYSECEIGEDGFLIGRPEISVSKVLPPSDDTEKNRVEPGEVCRSFIGMDDE